MNTDVYHGLHGRYWRYRSAPHPATTPVVNFIIEARWAHPLWHQYVLAVIHLRDQEGTEPAFLYNSQATHEFFLYALNPEHHREPDDQADLKWMTPQNFSAQFCAQSDEDAIRQMETVAKAIVDGQLHPDTDFRTMWKTMFPWNPYTRRDNGIV